MTIRRKCRVAAMIPLALLVLFEVGNCSANNASARLVETVGTADAVLRQHYAGRGSRGSRLRHENFWRRHQIRARQTKRRSPANERA